MKRMVIILFFGFIAAPVVAQDSSGVITVKKPVKYDLYTSFGGLKGSCKASLEEVRKHYKIHVWNKASDASFSIKSFKISGVDYGTRYTFYVVGDEMDPGMQNSFKEMKFKKLEIHDVLVELEDGTEAFAKGVSIHVSRL